MKLIPISNLTSAAFALAFASLLPHTAHAGGQGYNQTELRDTSKESFSTSSGSDLGLGKFSSSPFHVSVSVRGGYDDNFRLSSTDPQGSFFTNVGLGLTYEFGGPRTRMSLAANAGFSYYFDNSENNNSFVRSDDSDNYDVNASVAFSITHKATPRLTLAASVLASYQSVPNFETFNNSTISLSRQSRDFFFSSNRFSVGYAWTPRFSTVTSYSLGIVNYRDDVISRFEDRFEHTIGNEFRFLVLPTTTAVAEYRFGFVDYTENDSRSSTSHFLLAGVDHSFSPRFNISVRAGVEFRNLEDSNIFRGEDNRTAPYVEGTLNYALGQNTSLSLTNRYSLEQPDVPEVRTRQTFRTGLGVRHNFTSRISAGLNFAYEHDDNQGVVGLSGFTEDAFDLSLGVRYAVNRNWAIDVGYQHTEVVSEESLFRDFSRNRYYAGVTFTF